LFSATLAVSLLSCDGRSVERKEGDTHGWRVLAPLPDPTGYGGMFAGVLDGRLVTGGGTQWDKPIWREGTKIFSDRIFVLEKLDGVWREQGVTLPVKSGHFASASTEDAIYLAGGISAEGCMRSVWELRSAEEGYAFRSLPDLPRPIGYGAAAIASGRLYVIGGVRDPAARSALSEVWSLSLGETASPGVWRREADLPGTGVFVHLASSDGKDVFVFGGMAFDAEQKYRPSREAYRLDTTEARWVRLPDLPEPRVGATGPGQLLPDGRIFVVGGYKEVFPGAMRDHPGFSTQTYLYNLSGGRWERGPLLPVSNVPDRDSPGDPGPSPMIGATSVIWRDHVVVLSGEVRASVRSPAVVAWPLSRTD
jgi:N-acetylneuraminic acid mutarotase